MPVQMPNMLLAVTEKAERPAAVIIELARSSATPTRATRTMTA